MWRSINPNRHTQFCKRVCLNAERTFRMHWSINRPSMLQCPGSGVRRPVMQNKFIAWADGGGVTWKSPSWRTGYTNTHRLQLTVRPLWANVRVSASSQRVIQKQGSSWAAWGHPCSETVHTLWILPPTAFKPGEAAVSHIILCFLSILQCF